MMAVGFICFDTYERKLRNLTDEEMGRLFRAMLHYHNTGEEMELSGKESAAFDFIREDIDAGDERYKAKCETNRKNRVRAVRKQEQQEPADSEEEAATDGFGTTVEKRPQNKIKNKNQKQKKNKYDTISAPFDIVSPLLSSTPLSSDLPEKREGERELSVTDPEKNVISIPEETRMSFTQAVSYLREKVDYEALKCNFDLPFLDSVIDVMAEMLSEPGEYLMISGRQRSLEYVRKQIESYNHTVMEYLLTGLSEGSRRVRSVKNYMMACILNAPDTMAFSHDANARHVLYALA